MPTYLFIVIPIMLAISVFSMWMKWRFRNRTYKIIEPSYLTFFEATGYRVEGKLQDPTPESAKQTAEAWIEYLKGKSKNLELRFERLYHDLPMHHQMTIRTKINTTSGSIFWYAKTAPPKALMHVCDKDLGSIKKALGNMFSNVEVEFKREYNTRVATGDPAFDKRFTVYAPDPDAALEVLATPGLKESMLALKSVDLRVLPDAIEFVDIEQKNIASAMQLSRVKWVLPYVHYSVTEQQPIHEMISEVIHRMWVANQ